MIYKNHPVTINEMAIPFLNLQPITPYDDPSAEVVDAQILVPSHPYHLDDLYISRSTIVGPHGRLTSRGLFTARALAPGRLLGFFTGHMIHNDAYESFSPEIQETLGEYAASMETADYTVSPIDPSNVSVGVDMLLHPLAIANEPSHGNKANVFAESRLLDAGDAQFACICMFACVTIAAGGELCWSYGDGFRRRGYAGGDDCDRPSRPDNPLEMLRLSRMHPSFPFVAVHVEDRISSESSGDEYQP